MAPGGGIAEAVSADGTTVVGSAGTLEPGTWRAFRWRLDTGTVEDLGIIPAGSSGRSRGTAVSADGSVIAGYCQSNPSPGTTVERAFRWTAQTGMVELPDLPGGSLRFQANGMSGDGSVIAGWSAGDQTGPAVRWTAQTGTVPLGHPPGLPSNSSHAYAVSADGSTIVGDVWHSGGATLEAFRWTEQTCMVVLGLAGFPGMQTSTATAVSADGSVIVGYATGINDDGLALQEAFRWTEETGMVLLGSLPGTLPFSQATGVSADGSIVVGNGRGGWIWTEETGMVRMSDYLTGLGITIGPYAIYRVDGISADGTVIVGTAWDSQLFPVAWAAVIPAPASVGFALASVSLVLARRRR